MKFWAFCLAASILVAQGPLDSARLRQPLNDSWVTYNGDYSGRRYSALAAVKTSNVGSLNLAWTYRANPGQGSTSGGGSGNVVIKGTPLLINGILYLTAPDHVWA